MLCCNFERIFLLFVWRSYFLACVECRKYYWIRCIAIVRFQSSLPNSKRKTLKPYNTHLPILILYISFPYFYLLFFFLLIFNPFDLDSMTLINLCRCTHNNIRMQFIRLKRTIYRYKEMSKKKTKRDNIRKCIFKAKKKNTHKQRRIWKEEEKGTNKRYWTLSTFGFYQR